MNKKMIVRELSSEDMAKATKICAECIGIFTKHTKEKDDSAVVIYAMKILTDSFEKLTNVKLSEVMVKDKDVVMGVAS